MWEIPLGVVVEGEEEKKEKEVINDSWKKLFTEDFSISYAESINIYDIGVRSRR